jgi:hypothetical protein
VERAQRAEQSNSDRVTRCAEEEGWDVLLFLSDDEVGALQGAIRAERAQQLDAVQHLASGHVDGLWLRRLL